MPLYRVHTYDSAHWATLIVRATDPEPAGEFARRFVAAMQAGCHPADHARRWPEILRVEQARAWFDAEEDFGPVVESVEEIEGAVLEECTAN